MTMQPAMPVGPAMDTPLEQISQLCAVLALIGQMTESRLPDTVGPDERMLAAAYQAAPGIARRQFEVLADETSKIAAVGVRALLDRTPVTDAPAALLGRVLQARLETMGSLVGA